MADGDEEFARLTLDGDRFTGGRLPIDALVELERYRDMILEAAKRAYMRENAVGEVPPDFADQFDLGFTKVEDGSATPLLEKPPSRYDAYYSLGRDDIDAGFAAIINENFAPITQPVVNAAGLIVEPVIDLTPDAAAVTYLVDLPAFREFGSSLLPDELLKLPRRADRDEVEVSATSAVEKFLPFVEYVEVSRREPPEPVLVSEKLVSTVAGRLVALDTARMNFKMETLHYDTVTGKYQELEMTENLKAVLNTSAQAPLVRVTGRMSWRAGSLYRILSVDTVDLLEIEAEPWSRRFIELASLAESWHPEEPSELISFDAIDVARQMLRSVADLGHQPSIFGEASGGVTVEWVTDSRVISAEISPKGAVFLFDLNTTDGQASETDTENLETVQTLLREALA